MQMILPLITALLIATAACNEEQVSRNSVQVMTQVVMDSFPESTGFAAELSEAALSLTKDHVQYDPSYFSIPYPNGEVPAGKGVCTDVVIRAYRKLGFDLQKAVHEDMKANFSKYPMRWGLKGTDTNIDHRRVPNLMTFFSRQGAGKPITDDGWDYLPGDVVSWLLPGGLPHIGIVVDRKSVDGKRYMMVHNIGQGQALSDCLFEYSITGHYRFYIP